MKCLPERALPPPYHMNDTRLVTCTAVNTWGDYGGCDKSWYWRAELGCVHTSLITSSHKFTPLVQVYVVIILLFRAGKIGGNENLYTGV